MISVVNLATTVRGLVISLSENDARAVLVALESATSEEDPVVFEFVEQIEAALRAKP